MTYPSPFNREHNPSAGKLHIGRGPEANPSKEQKMSRVILLMLSAALTSGAIDASFAAQYGTREEAQAMVKKAIAHIKDQGPAKAYAEISNREGQFVDRDLYVVVYGLDGKVLAHGGNAKLIGKDMIDAQDADGKFFVKERVKLAREQASFWQDYKITNPTDKKVEPKQMYCERLDETAVCSGIYKY
jgi:cytochrome c